MGERDGSLVVRSSSNPASQSKAFRWTAATGMQGLAGLLTATGASLNGFTNLAVALAVSANGQFIVGQGADAAGHTPASDARERLMVQEHGLAAQLLGENGAIGTGAEIGILALASSAEGGGSGRIAFGNGLTLLGGLFYQEERLKDVKVKDAVMGALRRV